MNRRGFFRSVAALVGAASVSPTIFIPKFEPVKWKPPLRAKARDLRDFYGEWQFVTYKANAEGIWIKDTETTMPIKQSSPWAGVRCEVRDNLVSFHDIRGPIQKTSAG